MTTKQRRGEPRRHQRGAAGGPGVRGTRGARAAERRPAVDLPGRGAADQPRGRQTVDALECVAWIGPQPAQRRALGATATWWSCRGRCGGASTAPARRRCRGWRWRRPRAGSSVAQRAHEDAQARLGLEGRRLLRAAADEPRRSGRPGRSREPASARPPAGAGAPGRGSPRRCGGSRSAAAVPGSRGSRSSWSTCTAARSARRCSSSRAHSRPSVTTSVVGPSAAIAAGLAGRRESADRPRPPPRRSRSRVSARVRWMAPRNRGCRPGRRAWPARGPRWSPGAAPAAGGTPRSGGARRRPAGGTRPRCSPSSASSSRVADRPQPVVALGPVEEVAVGRLGHRRRGPARAPATGPRWTSRIGAGFSSISAIRVASSAGLRVVDPLVGQHDPVLRVRGPPRDVQRADQSPDREPARGVLVQVQRGLGVAREVPLSLPALARRFGTSWYGRAKARAEAGSPTRCGDSTMPRNGCSRNGPAAADGSARGAGVASGSS